MGADMETAGTLMLVQQARGGDQDAWNELFRRMQPRLLHQAAQLLLPDWPGESASHVLSLAWQRGWRGIGKFEFKGAGTDLDDAAAARMLCAWMRQVVKSAYSNGVVRPARRLPPTQRMS